MSITAAVGSYIVNPNNTNVSLSSLFNITQDINNPTYIDVTMLDREEYTVSNTGTVGVFENSTEYLKPISGQELSWLGGVSGTNIYTQGIIFTLQSNGRYYNSQIGYFDQASFNQSSNQNELASISVFYTNDLSVVNSIQQSPYYYIQPTNLAEYIALTGSNGYAGTVDVNTRSDIPSGALSNATPSLICDAAQTFVGKTWNIDGCWVLASNIAAQAGASLPPTSVGAATTPLNPSVPVNAPLPGGEWIVAYNGPALQSSASIASAEAGLLPGDVVTVQWQGGGGHIFTVTSGFGSSALTIDNEYITNSNGAIVNSANDGSSSDIVIQSAHSVNSELVGGGAIPSSIVVYRLDTPTITVRSPNNAVIAGNSVSLSSLFSTTDAGGVGTKPITDYFVYDTGTGSGTSDTFSFGGGNYAAHSATHPLAVPAAELSTLTLQTSGTGSGTDTVYVYAANGTYNGDFATLSFNITAGAISGTLTASQAATDYNGNFLTTPISVADSAANVGTNIDALEGAAVAGKLSSITLTDGGIPTLSISASQLTSDAAAIKAISGSFSLSEAAPAASATIVGAANALGNTLVLSGAASDYTITSQGDGVHLNVSGNGASDTVSDIQALQFADHTDIVAATPGPANAVTTGNITELYSAVLAREPDLGGLTFYQNYLKSNPATPLQQFADYFLSSSEYVSAHDYAQSTAGDTQFIEDSYQNLLHRTPSADEVNFYLTNVMAKAEANLTPGTAAFASAQFQAHALMLVYFSASAEFLSDVQVTAANPTSAQHWLVLI